MRKITMGVAIFFVIGLLISSATAVPQTYSEPAMNIIDKIEHMEQVLEEKENALLNGSFRTSGIFDWIVDLILLLINLVMKIIEIVQNVMGIFNLIQNLIDAINLLFDYIGQLIELIDSILNPSI